MVLLLGNPSEPHTTRVLLLGSGELGKEVALEFMRLGAWVCAADSYLHAPAASVADEARVLDMSDATALTQLIEKVNPTIIVPEIEAIATEVLSDAASKGIIVAASSRAIEICMDRERLRTLAAEQLGLPTTPYRFVGSEDEMRRAVHEIGTPCVTKPVMSSSGHGQSIIKFADDYVIADAWEIAQNERRAAREDEVSRVIVEAFAPIDYELTLLTVSSTAGVVCCAPIGQRQEKGDYRESWQPAYMPNPDVLSQAEHIARTMVEGMVELAKKDGEQCLGVFGVELFVLTDGSVLFNEVSPRPHDTGMVTLASQNFSEFALHARALLGVPITADTVALRRPNTVWASRPLITEGYGRVAFTGIEKALSIPTADLRIFGKPYVHGHRRMGVALASGDHAFEARQRTAKIINSLETIHL